MIKIYNNPAAAVIIVVDAVGIVGKYTDFFHNFHSYAGV